MRSQARSQGNGHGHLVIIGGGEDREKDKVVLSRFVELSGGEDARIVVVTAASTLHDEMWQVYDEAFGDLGVRDRGTVAIQTREEACDESIAARVFEADGIFMTGGDQKRLLALTGGTRIDKAMHRALRERGACIGGTSAGASAMSEHMLFDGSRELLPQKGSVHLAAGLGFVRRVVIDQHFSERQRLGRLLTIVAQNPYLLGAGIDEDTALVIEPGRGIEVIGEGAVTIIDGREMLSNFLEASNHDSLEMTNVKLHLLPAGARYSLDDWSERPPDPDRRPISHALFDVVAAVTAMPETAMEPRPTGDTHESR
jgi:cyanophycinase